MTDIRETPAEEQHSALAVLRRFARPRDLRERCELCAAVLREEHPHLLEPATRRLVCACDACSLLFSGNTEKFRRIPWQTSFLADFQLTDERWAEFGIPLQLAFFF